MNRIFRKPNFSLFRRKKKETDVGAGVPRSALEQLPIEVKRHIASFLPIRDLLKLSETSKRIDRDLDIVVLSSPLTDRYSQNKIIRTCSTRECFAVVIPNQEELRSHPTTFTFDVGAMFMDGNVWVVEQDLPADQTPDMLKSRSFRGGKSVADTTITEIGKMSLSFVPKAGKFYQFWVDTETEVHFNNMMLHHVGLGMKPSSHVAYQFEVRRAPRIQVCSFALR